MSAKTNGLMKYFINLFCFISPTLFQTVTNYCITKQPSFFVLLFFVISLYNFTISFSCTTVPNRQPIRGKLFSLTCVFSHLVLFHLFIQVELFKLFMHCSCSFTLLLWQGNNLEIWKQQQQQHTLGFTNLSVQCVLSMTFNLYL